MSNVIPFSSEEFSVRVVMLDGKEWFVGKDAADQLGYADTTNAIKQHCRGVAKHHPIPDALGRMQETRIISEPDLYRLIAGSHLPAAERFERWVFEEVLPTIRKTGGYSAGRQPTPAEMLLANAQVLVDLERQQAQHQAALERVESRVEEVAAGVRTLTQRPTNSESITHIRVRILKLYGIPARVVNHIVLDSPLALTPAGMVRHTRDEAEGGAYAVYWVRHVNDLFRRFVSECTRVTPAFATHPYVEDRFRLAAGVETKEAV